MAESDLTSGGSIRRISRWGEPVMHTPTRPVNEYGEELHALIRDMFATMDAAAGVGLAATQVGVDLAVFVYSCPDADDRIHTGVICNPVVTLPDPRARHLDVGDEGCLSLPGAFETLPRPDRATCRGFDAFGEPVEVVGTGLLARCLQHETDHLNGTVFGDRLPGRKRKLLFEAAAEVSDSYPADWPVSPRVRPAGAQPVGEEDEL